MFDFFCFSYTHTQWSHHDGLWKDKSHGNKVIEIPCCGLILDFNRVVIFSYTKFLMIFLRFFVIKKKEFRRVSLSFEPEKAKNYHLNVVSNF